MAAMQGSTANPALVQAMQVDHIYSKGFQPCLQTAVLGALIYWTAAVLLQARLESLVGRPSGLIETLPKPIQRRIKYLSNLQEEYDTKEEEYQKELDELDRKYAALYGAVTGPYRFLKSPHRQVEQQLESIQPRAAPIFARRAEIVKGAADAPEDMAADVREGAETGPEGVPSFWLGVLQANELTASRVSIVFVCNFNV